jgi:hypothetical protein
MRSDGRRAAASFSGLSALAVVLFTALGLSLEPAHSQASSGTTGNPADKAIKATDLRGEWLRAGPGFACKVPAGEKLPPELITPEILGRACLYIGPFVIGDDAQALIAALGAPHRTLPQPNGAKASIYFLEQAGQYPYLVATVSKNRIVALQVTGPVAAKGYTFNHIDLGATTDTLAQYFGRPNHLEPSSEQDTELWAYRPWPFSFEIKDGHVTSIRIADPTE